MEAPLLISQQEAARLLGVERTTIWRMLKRQDLTPVSVGSRRLVTRVSLDDYVRSQAEDR
ncbi:helix-turn-helix domain-containing protein [Nocardioides sp. URHA0032]|uniref:helix-turn-helix domain-containing protein n=1 Tax=Nocardioides sp. URHA0032 TaxID=1380388 RepID=UPI00048AC4FF